ncbi:substrate-binding domain-containing protein, partial [Oleiagrimonas sp.]|jgi:LacI family transcriptional regulator|uniref:LacI family DNA-binding transcriptional regulator n=1 Tax=Oleiagrimonas sp. TaxID=2010330 RepID=UPI00261AEF76
VMSPYADAGFLADNLPAALPTILINTPNATSLPTVINVDNRMGARVMVAHLAALGHRRITFITGPESNFEAQQRLQGFREAMAELLPGAPIEILPGEFTDLSGHQAGQQLLRLDIRPDAVFAANDMMAIGCLSALHEAGMRVPQDIALAGFDDIPMARYVTPALTTVRVHISDLGERALTRLLHVIENPDAPTQGEDLMASELVVRASCGGSLSEPVAREQ